MATSWSAAVTPVRMSHDQHDDVGVVNGDLRLAAHELQDFVVVPRLDAAGVHDGELPAVPVAVGVEPVTGDARGVLHDGQALACQFIEQHGLAHVGASYDGYHRFCHGLHFLTLSHCFPSAYHEREGLYWKYSVSSGSAQSPSGLWVLSTPNMASSRANPSCSTKVSGTPSACSTCSTVTSSKKTF